MSKKEKREIGFNITDTKEKTFDIMLQSIIDFTISHSKCNVFYENKEGKIWNKTYFNNKTEPFYINGTTYKKKNGTWVNNIFKGMSKKRFD